MNTMVMNGVVTDGRVTGGMGFAWIGRRPDTGFRRIALVGLGLENQRHGAEMLHDRDSGAGNKPADNGGKHNRTKDGHLRSVAGKRIRMANVVRGVMDGIDMRKTDNAHDEQTESHGQNRLENGAQIFAGNRQIGGVRLLHNGSPWKTKTFLAEAGNRRDS
jgi:hypothetical protein